MSTINVTVTQRTPIEVSVGTSTPIAASVAPATPIQASVSPATPINASVAVRSPIQVMLNVGSGSAFKNSFWYLIWTWTVKPTVVGTVAAGSVYEIINGSSTVYMLKPVPYDPTQHAVYSDFTGGILSGLMATRA